MRHRAAVDDFKIDRARPYRISLGSDGPFTERDGEGTATSFRVAISLCVAVLLRLLAGARCGVRVAHGVTWLIGLRPAARSSRDQQGNCEPDRVAHPVPFHSWLQFRCSNRFRTATLGRWTQEAGQMG